MAKSPIKLKVASPCSASWNEMEGDDAIRHCGACDKKVYQLSNMSSEEVETFLLGRRSRGLRTCVRFYQRADGTMLTSDCSVGKARKRKQRVVRAVGAMAVSASAVGIGMRAQSSAAPTEPAVAPPSVVQPVEATATPPVVVEPVTEPELIEMLGEEIDMPEHLEPVLGGLIDEPIEMLGDLEYIPTEDAPPEDGE